MVCKSRPSPTNFAWSILEYLDPFDKIQNCMKHIHLVTDDGLFEQKLFTK